MALTTTQILNYHKSIRAESDKAFGLVEKGWIENIALYDNSFEWEGKAEWQSKIDDPIAEGHVSKLVNFYKRMLIAGNSDFFTLELPKVAGENTAEALRDLVRAVLIRNKYNTEVFAPGLTWALLTSPYITKVEYRYFTETYPVQAVPGTPITMQEDIRGMTFVEYINPRDIRLDAGGNQYIIEKRKIALSDFVATARANKWIKGPVERIIQAHTAKGLDKETATENYTPEVELEYAYTRSISNEYGQELAKNYEYIVADGTEVVNAQPNTRVNGRFPYTVCFPMRTFTTRYGKGYLDKIKSDIIAYLDSLNLIFDKFKLSTLGVYEYNAQAVNQEHAGTMTVAPNKWIGMDEVGTIRNIFQNAIDPMSINVHGLIDSKLKQASGQNEAFTGANVSKRQTADEFNGKATQVQGMLLDIAHDIEETHFEDMIALIAETELMHMGDTFRFPIENNIDSKDSFEAIKDLSFADRVQMIRDATVKARGISGKIAKAQEFDKTIKILGVVGNIPTVAAALDPEKLVERIFGSFDDAPEELINMAIIRAMKQQSPGGQDEDNFDENEQPDAQAVPAPPGQNPPGVQ